MLAIIQDLLGEFSKSFYVCYNVLQANRGNKDGSQMIVPVRNKMYLPGLEDREAASFQNLTRLCISYILLG